MLRPAPLASNFGGEFHSLRLGSLQPSALVVFAPSSLVGFLLAKRDLRAESGDLSLGLGERGGVGDVPRVRPGVGSVVVVVVVVVSIVGVGDGAVRGGVAAGGCESRVRGVQLAPHLLRVSVRHVQPAAEHAEVRVLGTELEFLLLEDVFEVGVFRAEHIDGSVDAGRWGRWPAGSARVWRHQRVGRAGSRGLALGLGSVPRLSLHLLDGPVSTWKGKVSRVGCDDAQLWRIWRVPKSRRRVGGGGWVRACGAHPMVVASAQKSSSSSSNPTVKPMAATRRRPRAQTEWREPAFDHFKSRASSRRPVSPNEWFPRVL